MVESKNSVRYEFLDALRIKATLAVVLIHTITGVMDTHDMTAYPVEKTFFLVLMDWITWCVPIFLMISGFLFLDRNRELPIGRIYGKYCRRMVTALFVFGVPYAWIEIWINNNQFSVRDILGGIIMVCTGKSWSHLWYVYLIIFLYLITPMLQWMVKIIPRWVLLIILTGLFTGSSVLPFIKLFLGDERIPALPAGGIYLFYYLTGFVIKDADNRICNTGKYRKGWICVLLVAILSILAGTFMSRISGNYSIQMAYNYPFTVILSILLFMIAGAVEADGQKKNTFLNKEISEMCFGVYLLHPLFINICYKGLDITPLDYPVWLSVPAFWCGITGLSFISIYVLRKIPVFRYYII